jgi:hypothetical protein
MPMLNSNALFFQVSSFFVIPAHHSTMSRGGGGNPNYNDLLKKTEVRIG